jgi:molybdopterin molybdotransferase
VNAAIDIQRKPAMLSLDEAIERLLGHVKPPAPERAESVSTFDALGRVLAEDVRSLLDVPPADNSEMDGYALRAADAAAPGAVLRVSQRIAAGNVGTPLESGTAARIFTGAQIPAGADAVVMQELCTPVEGAVRVDAVPQQGQSIRRRGEDVRRDATVLRAGVRLSAQSLGMAASVGTATLRVGKRPRVGLFSTGDELAMPGDTL